MIYLELFWIFFRIGLFTIGGGYAMIPMITQEIVDEKGWLTDTQLLNYIGISESTPGPFAINIATFVGTSQGGVLGGVVATFSVVLPSLIIILIFCGYLLENQQKQIFERRFRRNQARCDGAYFRGGRVHSLAGNFAFDESQGFFLCGQLV